MARIANDPDKLIAEHLAKAAHYAEAQVIEIEAIIPLVRETYPRLYEAILHLTVGASQNHDTIASAAEDIVAHRKRLETPPIGSLPAPATPTRVLYVTED